jgi:Kef-type K+ transport system membrane component KefB
LYLRRIERLQHPITATSVGITARVFKDMRASRSGEARWKTLIQRSSSLFFVLVGFRTNIAALGRPAVVALAVALSIAAVVGKLSCAIGVLNFGVRRLTVAAGMIPRGEITLVFAALGSAVQFGQAPLLDERGYTAVVKVLTVTALVTPPALKWSTGARSGSHGVTTGSVSATPVPRVVDRTQQ